ncbi:hypothetical protein, partial [Oceanobacillus damuensis]|uniref:hypothetical protein n=1 Tax=Oceanobacillus damuensis TaxID=937928 RepID=UPI001F3139F8
MKGMSQALDCVKKEIFVIYKGYGIIFSFHDKKPLIQNVSAVSPCLAASYSCRGKAPTTIGA